MAWCIGSVGTTRQLVPAITMSPNLNFTLPRRGGACGRTRARRSSSRKKIRDSASVIIPTTTTNDTVVKEVEEDDEVYVAPKLPGEEPDFWEGPQWDTVGFIMQYLWAFGFLFAIVACGVAVRTYNFGAADFKDTPVYKEAIESQGLFEEAPETPESQVFETNPTEIAPSPYVLMHGWNAAQGNRWVEVDGRKPTSHYRHSMVPMTFYSFFSLSYFLLLESRMYISI